MVISRNLLWIPVHTYLHLHSASIICINLYTMPIKLRLIVYSVITEGKIFVELERARVTKRLSDVKEKNGQVKEACDILNEIQV